MDTFLDFNGYYVALIIITIVTIAISIALSFYFIFIPSVRIADEFDTLQSRGLRALQDVTNLINTTTNLSEEVLKDVCDSVIYTADKLFGKPLICGTDERGCILDLFCVNNNPLIPSICAPFITNIPDCCLTNTCPACVPPT